MIYISYARVSLPLLSHAEENLDFVWLMAEEIDCSPFYWERKI